MDAKCVFTSKGHILRQRKLWFRKRGLYTTLLMPQFALTQNAVLSIKTHFAMDAKCVFTSKGHILRKRKLWFRKGGLYTTLLMPQFALTQNAVLSIKTHFAMDAKCVFISKGHILRQRKASLVLHLAQNMVFQENSPSPQLMIK